MRSRSSFEPSGSDAQLFTDEGKVSQILRNYISNALKFTEQRRSARQCARWSATARSSSKCRDTGIGIAPQDQDRLFQEFGQVPNRLQAKVRGTGLGLSLSKRLAELLGGSVGVRSTLGSRLHVHGCSVPMTAPGFELSADGHRAEPCRCATRRWRSSSTTSRRRVTCCAAA